MGNYNITVLKGDGIGPDIVAEAMNVLEAVEMCIRDRHMVFQV